MNYLVIPCYNEATRLDFNAFEQYQSSSMLSSPVYLLFVDDGSIDGTFEWLQIKIAEALAKNKISEANAKVSAIKLDKNSGKAEAVRSGMLYLAKQFKVTKNDWLGFWDADLATPLIELNKMLQVAAEEPKTISVWGSRVYRLGSEIKRSALRHYLGRVFATLIALILKVESYDSQCGAKIFRGDLVETAFAEPFISRWIFDVEILLRLNQKNIIEYPLRKWIDQPGSKVKIFKEIGRVWRDIWAIRTKYIK